MEMKKYKLGEIASFIGSGMTPLRSNENYWNSKDYPWLKTEQLGEYQIFDTNEYISKVALEETNLKLFPKNTLSVAMYGEGKTRGNVSILAEQMTTNQACCNIIVDNKFANYKFVYYWLKNSYYKLRSLSSGIRNNLNSEDIKKFEINLPSLPTQQKIAAVLSSLDDKIALNKKINAKLEAMAKRLYDYWFVQFDYPDKNGKPYKTSGGKMVWNEVLKREIPEGWEVVQIKKFFENEIPGDWGEEQPKKNNTYQVSCIRGCDMVTMNDLPIRYILPSNATKLLKPNDFVIEISGGSPTQSTGRIVQITEEIINRFDGNVICSNFCHGVRILNKKYISYFLRMWNMFYDNKVFFNYEGKTSGLKNFQFDTFVENKWYMPPEDIVKKYDLTVNKIKTKIDKNESENLKLTAMRDRLLPLLMNGQVVTN